MVNHLPAAGRALATAAAALCLVSTAAGAAHAQNSIPGDATPGTVVRVIPRYASVTVSPAGVTDTQVKGTFTNSSGSTLACSGVPSGQGVGGTVTEARVVQESLAYYTTFAVKPEPGAALTVAGSINIGIDLGDVPSLLPSGSIAPMFGDNFAARSAIADHHRAAKLSGQTGQVAAFTVNNGATASWSAALSAPTSGTRADFQAGALFVCSSGGTYYAFGGYEGAEPTPDPLGVLRTGSLGRY